MRTIPIAVALLLILGGCVATPAPAASKPPSPSVPPMRHVTEPSTDLPPEMRMVTVPVTDDPEELATFSRLGLPLDLYATLATGEEPVVCRIASKAAIITISKGSDARTSLMVAVAKEDVEVLVMTRDLVRRRQASIYATGSPRNAPARTGKSGDQAMALRQMLSRMGYEVPERKAAPPPPAEPAAKTAAPAPVEVPVAALNLPPLPDKLPPARILIDGSSTVFIMAKLVRDEFMRKYPGVTIDLMGVNAGESPSGTGGGFKKFCYGETDISDASRLIKDDEIRKCAANNVRFAELPLAYDGISLVVNRENTWVKNLTVQELKAIWAQDSKIMTWRDVRAEFPAQPIKLFSPGRDSGTFDFFSEEICGKGANPRPDMVTSEDDEVLVRGITSSPGGVGYFGLAYYIEHKDALRLVALDAGKGPVLPSPESVLEGSYSPLSRPLFLYVNARSLQRPEVSAFVTYFLKESMRVSQAVGYIPLPDDLRRLSADRFSRNIEGSMRATGQAPRSLRAMLARE
jgi:phosphate transport system substrate-binding protein